MRDWSKIIAAIPGYDPVATAEGAEFDEQAAQVALDFFEGPDYCLRHVKGPLAGQRFALILWERSIIANVFGWKNPDGMRRYRTVWLYVAKKNGKSTLSSGALCYCFFGDGEPGAEVYSVAADRDQASLIFDIAKGMIEQEPVLAGRVKVYKAYKSIERQDTVQGWWRVLAADADTAEGVNTHAYSGDEVHAHKKRDLLDVMETSTAARTQPLGFLTTTADWDRPSICNELYSRAIKVRDGVIAEPSFLPVIFEASEDDDWTDPVVWQKANPNLGVTVGRDYLETKCRKAQDEPAYENTFKRKHLNIRTGQSVRILPLEQWDGCLDAYTPESLYGAVCYGGLDLSATTDFTALTLLFPEAGNAVLSWLWYPADTVRERERRDGIPLGMWADQGWVELTPGRIIDYGYVRKRIQDVVQRCELRGLAYDPWNATQLARQLAEDDGIEMVQFRQGFASMNEPTKALVALTKAQKLRQRGNPVLRWMVSNLAGKTDPAGNLKPDKEKSSDRIDGVVALIMAIGLANVVGTAAPTTSVYETRGLTVL